MDGEPLCDFEKLTIAKLYIKKLEFESGIVQSERDEYKDLYETILKQNKEEQIAVYKKEAAIIYGERFRLQVVGLKREIENLKKDASKLVGQLILLNK